MEKMKTEIWNHGQFPLKRCTTAILQTRRKDSGKQCETFKLNIYNSNN